MTVSPGSLRGMTLIIPPVSSPTRPYPSVPQLAGFLRKKGIPVTALDANIAFCHAAFTGSRLREGEAYALHRLKELDGHSRLAFPEMVEYLSLARAGSILEHFGRDLLTEYLERKKPMPKELQGKILDAVSRLIFAPSFPENIRHNDEDMQYAPRGNSYASADLLEAAEEDGLFGSFFEEYLRPYFSTNPPRVAGLSVIFPGHIVPALRIARVIRRFSPKTHIVFGGPFVMFHLSRVPHNALFRYMDTMIVGDGEIPLQRLYEALKEEKPDFAGVPGLIYLEEGVRRCNPESPHLPLEEVYPEYGDFPPEDYYRKKGDAFVFFRLSRGCSWAKCAFCRTKSSLISAYQEGDPDRFFEQVRRYARETGAVFFPFTDDEASPELVEHFARRVLEEKLPVEWSINMRMDKKLTLDRCTLFREAGCINLILGLESFHDRILKLIKKGITVPLIEQVLSNVSWAGLRAGIYMIAGLPTETLEEAEYSFSRIARYCGEGDVSYVFYSPYQVLTDSCIGQNPREYGITNLKLPRGLDLDPPNVWFEGEGMTRRESFALMQKFSWAIWKILGKRMPLPLREVSLGGEIVPLRYDLMEIGSRVGGNTEPHVSFGGFLEGGSRMIPPLARKDVS